MVGGVIGASAATLSTFKIGNWDGGAYSAPGTNTADGTNAFDHCAATASYTSGVYVTFSISKTVQWSMGFENPAWSLTQGQSYPITFTVDSSPPSSANAVAISKTQVEVPLADSAALFEQFMQGLELKVGAASQNFVFNLTNTSQLLPALLRCVQNYAGTPSTPNNPFAAPGTTPNPFAPPGQN